LILVIGALIQIADIYQYVETYSFSIIKIILRVVNTILIIALCFGGTYLIYQVYSYRSSTFYRDYKIGTIEALSHGIMDMHLVYDKVRVLADSKTISVDFTNNIITFTRKFKHYSIIFADLFGKIDGKEGSDYWFSQRKPQKKYGRLVYAINIRFSNPIMFNQKYVVELTKETGKEYIDYVVLTGFYQLEFTNKKIISPYEIVSKVDQGSQE